MNQGGYNFGWQPSGNYGLLNPRPMAMGYYGNNNNNMQPMAFTPNQTPATPPPTPATPPVGNTGPGTGFGPAPTPAGAGNTGTWWNLNPTAAQTAWGQNQWKGFGNQNNLTDFLTRWNAFATPEQAFQWAGQQDMGGGGFKNALLMADQLSSLGGGGRNPLWSRYLNAGAGMGPF